jgi:hypothetical protein
LWQLGAGIGLFALLYPLLLRFAGDWLTLALLLLVSGAVSLVLSRVLGRLTAGYVAVENNDTL